MENLFGGAIPNFGQNQDEEEEPPTEEIKTKRSEIKQLEQGKLENEKVRIKVEQDPASMGMLGTNQNQQIQDMMNQLMPKKKSKEKFRLKQLEKS